MHENVLRKWVKEFGGDPAQAFPSHGQMKLNSLRSCGCGAHLAAPALAFAYSQMDEDSSIDMPASAT